MNISSYGNIMSNILYGDPSFNDGKTYNPRIAYGQSKTANILMAVSLNESWEYEHTHSILVVSISHSQTFDLLPANIMVGVPSQLRRHLLPESMKQAI